MKYQFNFQSLNEIGPASDNSTGVNNIVVGSQPESGTANGMFAELQSDVDLTIR